MYIGEQQVFCATAGDLEIDLYPIFLILQLENSGSNYLILDCLLHASDFQVCLRNEILLILKMNPKECYISEEG